MKFFDYVYYKCCQFYEKDEKAGAGISGLVLLSVFQCFNIISISAILAQFFHYTGTPNTKWLGIPMYLLVMILNCIRYNKTNYPDLKEKLKNETETTTRKKFRLVFLYMIVSVFIVIAVIVWRANAMSPDV
jgi:hypothetical protein